MKPASSLSGWPIGVMTSGSVEAGGEPEPARKGRLPLGQVAGRQPCYAANFSGSRGSPSGSPADRLWSDFEIVQKTGGAYILSFRSDLLGSPEHAPELRNLLGRIQASRAWMTTGSDLAEWWVRRERVHTVAQPIGDRRIRFQDARHAGDQVQRDGAGQFQILRQPAQLAHISLGQRFIKAHMP